MQAQVNIKKSNLLTLMLFQKYRLVWRREFLREILNSQNMHVQ